MVSRTIPYHTPATLCVGNTEIRPGKPEHRSWNLETQKLPNPGDRRSWEHRVRGNTGYYRQKFVTKHRISHLHNQTEQIKWILKKKIMIKSLDLRKQKEYRARKRSNVASFFIWQNLNESLWMKLQRLECLLRRDEMNFLAFLHFCFILINFCFYIFRFQSGYKMRLRSAAMFPDCIWFPANQRQSQGSLVTWPL